MKKLTIEEMDVLASLHGGKCIYRIYKNNCTKLEWECKFKHRWLATPYQIKKGQWCPCCAGQHVDIKDMDILASLKNGKCISRVYKNAKTKLEWECDSGHRWWAISGDIRNGRWCPKCSTKYITEHKCRYIIEQMIGHVLPSDWKILNNGQEIDGYNKELKIGFEYQGEQHYIQTRRFSKEEFKNIQKRDKKKKSKIYYLKKQGIIRDIIFIKYTQATSDKKLENYIIKRLNKIDPNLIKNKKVDYSGFYKYLSPLKKLKEIIENRDGILLNNIYIHNDKKVTIQCKSDHIFKMTPHDIKAGHWCPTCAKVAVGNIKELKQVVAKKQGILIDKVYKNNKTKLKIKCENGHIFRMVPYHLRNGHWCPLCYHNTELIIKNIHNFAKKNNAVLNESKYINSYTKMEWKCLECKAMWKASYRAMKNRKHFCQICKHNIKTHGG